MHGIVKKMRYIRKKHLSGEYKDIPQCKNCIEVD